MERIQLSPGPRGAALLLGSAILAACTGTSTSAEPIRHVGFAASESVYFDNLAEMVATSDLVVLGTVETVDPGMIEAPGTPEEIRHTNVTIRIDELLWGAGVDRSAVVETLELAYARPHREWRFRGAVVIAFLTESTEGRAIYIPTNHSQSIYAVDGLDVEAAVSDAVAERVAASSSADILLMVADAGAAVLRGEVQPKEREK